MDKKTQALIVAAQKLSEMGLHPLYARFVLERNEERFEAEEPVAVATELFGAADEEWKKKSAPEGAPAKDGSAPSGGTSSKDDGGYDPAAEGKALADRQKNERGRGYGDLAFQ